MAGPLAAILALVGALAAAALSIDVVRTGYGIKGDEATYVSMALSVAHDGDLEYTKNDLERFWRVYQSGPEGIFLKKGQNLELRLAQGWPFVRAQTTPEDRTDRLFFGKAFAYAVAAAPFVRIFGLNGLLLFHVLLWGAVLVLAYVFAARRGEPFAAALLALAFFGLSIAPLYMVWLTPEIFHVALVGVAYLVWFYPRHDRDGVEKASRLHGLGAALVAAVLLGVATFSKPPNVLLVVPPIVAAWRARQWGRGLLIGLVFSATVAGLFAANAAISGEFNYQGGDRRTYYGRFPFDRADARFESLGLAMTTNEVGADEVSDHEELSRTLWHNAIYFLVGRHAGFVPYYLPGVVVLGLWAAARKEWRLWHWALVGVLGASALVLLVTLPYSWAGGGGPPGNRYFLSLYPALFVLLPPLQSALVPALTIAGSGLFVAHILINPFVAAKSPWINAQGGLLRRLPIELTMVNDLPVMLDPGRARIPYGEPSLLLYFLDDHAWRPESAGIWVEGRAETEIIARTDLEVERFAFQLQSIVPNDVEVSAGGRRARARLAPGTPATLVVPASGVRTRGASAYVLRISASDGAVPALADVQSRDPRFLGVLMRITAQGR